MLSLKKILPNHPSFGCMYPDTQDGGDHLYTATRAHRGMRMFVPSGPTTA